MIDRRRHRLVRLATLREAYDEIISRINEEIDNANPRGNVFSIKVSKISPAPPDIVLAVSLLKLICRETNACDVISWRIMPRSNRSRDWRLQIYVKRWREVNFEEVWQRIYPQV